MELRDKRVDKVIAKRGLRPEQVFYNPPGVLPLLLLYAGYPLIACIIYCDLWIIGLVTLLTILYVLAAYLIFAKRGNNFVLTGRELVVINPNLPFRSYTVIKLNTIEEAVIDERRKGRNWYVLFLSNGYYLSIRTAGGIEKRYDCDNLMPDAFDENFTERTLDDLGFALEQKGVPTEFRCFDKPE